MLIVEKKFLYLATVHAYRQTHVRQTELWWQLFFDVLYVHIKLGYKSAEIVSSTVNDESTTGNVNDVNVTGVLL